MTVQTIGNIGDVKVTDKDIILLVAISAATLAIWHNYRDKIFK